MADVIEIVSRQRTVIEVNVRSVDVVEIGYRGAGVAWGSIIGDIRDQADLMELIAGLPQDEKEVVSVLTASDDAPLDAAENDLYIDTSDNTLYQYDGEDWNEAEASQNVLYITDDTSHIYRYDGSLFIDVTGQKIDDVIYVSSIDDPALEAYTEAGMYTVCISSRTGSRYYTLAVNIAKGPARIGVPPRTTYTQTLYNRDGYYARTKVNAGAWSDWSVFDYASEEYVNTEVQAAKEDLLPLIYAGL